MSEPIVTSVFVYGTLKRGQCRQSQWPLRPIQIREAHVLGCLYGRDDYPALRPGTDRVRGELWTFHDNQIGRVLRCLDAIECTDNNSPNDLYHRHVVDVYPDRDGEVTSAYGYFYVVDPIADGFVLVRADEFGCVSWP